MMSLPISNLGTEPPPPASACDPTGALIGSKRPEDERFLLHAFRSFAQAAASLERSYAKLREEVEQLKGELAASNSELARSAEENARMRAHLDRILESLPCGILVTSSDGQVLRTNPETHRILGNTAGYGDSISLSTFPEEIRQLLQVCREQDGELERLIAVGAATRWVAVRHAPLADAGEIFILRDISENKRLDEIAVRLQRDRELAAISALLAHEIRNPLGSLELFAGLLMESDLEVDQRRWVEHVQAGLRTLAATVNNVLHFHSLPAPQLTPVDLGDLLKWARDFCLPLARQRSLTLSLQNHLAGCVVSADRHRLEQVLLNLILNSVHVVPEGGWVELAGRRRCGENPQTAVLAVADTGPGIPAGDLTAIFDPGFSRKAGSPGLGLAVCRKIVGQHGGTIHAANRAPHGAVFTVTLPLVQRPEGVE